MVGEDDSLLFDFADRQMPPQSMTGGPPVHQVPPAAHHLHHSGRHQPPVIHNTYSTVDVNLEELHREEQKRMMGRQARDEDQPDEEWSL